MRVGEGVQERGGDVPVHHRYAVLRPPTVGRFVLVEEALADEVALVVLVDPGPSHEAFHITGLIQAFWNAVLMKRGGSQPSDSSTELTCRIPKPKPQ